MITVVGLGLKKGEITEAGKRALTAASFAVGRTQKELFGVKVNETLDELYNSASDYDRFNRLAAERLISLEKEYGEIAYAVAGDGFSDASAELLSSLTTVQFVAGAAASRPASTSFVQLSAYDLHLAPQPDNLPLTVTAVDNALVAGEVKLYLLKFYDYDTTVQFYRGETVTWIDLEDIDRQPKYGADCRIFIPTQKGFDKKTYTFGDLVRIMERLTGDGGCPWDKEQTHKSIRANMIEEAYEAVAAIDSGDTENLIEELGDVLLQSVFHADMGRRFGEFELCDVLSRLCRKLYTRHTHIFGESKANDSDEALSSWEKAKAKEKAEQGIKKDATDEFNGFPSLLRAQKTAKKMIKSGAALGATSNKLTGEQAGRLLFELAAQCYNSGIDAETELNAYLNSLKK